MHLIESLEPRIAPAVLINPSTVKFIDADGDNVTVHISKPLFTEANIKTAFTFEPGHDLPGGDVGEYLSKFDVKQLGLAAQGLDIAITAKRSAIHGGNGRIDIGSIDAFDAGDANSLDLGRVRLQGDLKFIDAGDALLSTPGLKSLDVASIGEQISGVKSEINGSIGSVKIRGDMLGFWEMKGDFNSTVGSFFIGGSLGDSTLDVQDAGAVHLQGKIGQVRVGHNLIGSEGFGTGRLRLAGNVGSVDIGGSLIGGSGAGGGALQLLGFTKSVRVHGGIVGGSGSSSGVLSGNPNQGGAGIVRVDGSVIGGTDNFTGVIALDSIGSLTVGGDVIGRADGNTGFINLGSAKLVHVRGSLQGIEDPGEVLTPNNVSGSIIASRSLGKVQIDGDVCNASIIAGIQSGDDKEFGAGTGGDADRDADPGLISSIASIVIRGAVNSTGSHHYAIEANQLGPIKIGTVTYSPADPTLDFTTGFFVNARDTVTVREI